MSNLVNHAKYELTLLCDNDPDFMQDAMNKHIIGIVELFSEEGHSGYSANYAANLIDRLLRFKPLTPLTGKDEEWCEIENGKTWQNKRCGHVFKGADGKAYDINGRIFREPDGSCYIGKDSRVFIEFPYTPKSEYVDRPSEVA